MRRVPRCEMRPLHCAVYPQLGAGHPKGYFDSGNTIGLAEEHIYISVEAVESLARELGWASPETQKAHGAAYEALERENHDLREQVREADKFAESAEYTLGRFGQSVKRKPGPRAKVAQEA